MQRIKSPLIRFPLAAALALGCSLMGCSGSEQDPNTPRTESGQLRVIAAEARACDVLVEATGGRVVSTEFEAGLSGKAVYEGDRAGISFVSNGAEPLATNAGTLTFTGELKLLDSTCYGEDGQALSGAGVEL